jgi:acyl-coenzyme A thioesterase PaaI-like protein
VGLVTQRFPLANTFSVARSCFGCGPDSPAGLKLAFDAVGETVEASFTLSSQHSGAPAFAHGGIVMTVLDEAMAWGCIAIRRRFALTKDWRGEFHVPVLIGRPYTVVGLPDAVDERGRVILARGEVRDADGTLCASAEGTYWAMTAEQTAAATGLTSLTEEFERFEFPPGRC